MRRAAFERVVRRLEALDLAPAYGKNKMTYGDAISAFITDKLARSAKLVAIISEKYLRSEFCMLELIKVYRFCGSDGEQFIRRVRAVTLEDARIWTPKDRLAAQDYWKKRRDDYQALVRRGDLPLKDYERYDAIKQFADEAAAVLGHVADTLHARSLHARSLEEIDRLSFEPAG